MPRVRTPGRGGFGRPSDMAAIYPDTWPALDVVLSHDWLTGMRGGERVLELLCGGFPRAPLCTLVHNRAAVSDIINAHPVHASLLRHVPGIHQRYRWFLPVFPLAIRALRCPPGRLLISTSHCVAKDLRPAPGMKHLCYCFTPMRYAWTFHAEYFGRNRLKRLAISPLLAALRRWDRRASQRVDRFVTLSRHVQDRIRRFYNREADVVYPPVQTAYFTPDGRPPGEFDLIVSALVPYKRLDLAVRAYTRSRRALKIVGTGTESDNLQRLAGPNIEFLGWRSDDDIRELYRRCRLLVFPGEEDFGLVPVEVQACGRPVVAFGCGGALETVIDGETGLFFRDKTEAALNAAVEDCASRRWDADRIRGQAERFGPQPFVDGLDRCIREILAS